MYLKYGSYTHALGEPGWVITKDAVLSPQGDVYAVRERWNISGLLTNQGGTAADMKTKIAALEAAYAVDGQDAVVYLPDGVTESNHKITSSGTIGGTKVMQRPSYPRPAGPEGITMRTFTLAIEALVPVSGSQVILGFEEMVEFSGGGPRFALIETGTSFPIAQKLRRATIYRASQRGRAVGLYGYPLVPAPLWPLSQIEAPTISRRSPRRWGASYTEYEVSWSYEFQSAFPLLGGPHRTTL